MVPAAVYNMYVCMFVHAKHTEPGFIDMKVSVIYSLLVPDILPNGSRRCNSYLKSQKPYLYIFVMFKINILVDFLHHQLFLTSETLFYPMTSEKKHISVDFLQDFLAVR